MANYRPFRASVLWPAIIAIVLASSYSGLSQVVYKQPPPGSIYREYTRIMNGDKDWRVTDPNTVCTDWRTLACDYIPNPVLHLNVDDLSGAVRAEAIFSIWGGHLGTAGKSVRFNGDPHSWIPLNPPDQSNGIPSGEDGLMYMYEICEGVDVPLSDLHTGDNYFEGNCAGQIMNPSTGWGQFGWFAVVLRIYYDNSKSHPTGSITSPTAGSSFGENPTITASVSGGVDRVDFVAYYDGYDTDGDGIYQEYHGDYHINPSDGEVEFRNHVGTATGSPFQATWSTQWIPDQAPGGIKLVARIRDNNGVWYVTDEVTGLTLSRPNSSVKLYRPQNVPTSYWVKQYMESKSSTFTIPAGDNLSVATGAIFLIRSWNGINGAAEAPNDAYYIKVNDWTAPSFGNNHYYSFDALGISPSELANGTNTVTAYCNSIHHGIEVLWPGPTVMVRYGAAQSNYPPSITQQPSNQTAGVGETATFTVQATGSPAPSYQWQKDGVDITLNGNGSSYTTPPLTQADNGAGYRCVVSNSEGTVYSNTAYVTVSTVAAHITTEPTNQTVGIGETATFTVAASGSGTLQYQWQKNGTNISSNGNAASYTTPPVAKADSGSGFRCIVSNAGGADTSVTAYLIVATVPAKVTTHPTNQTVGVGETATFSVVASGSGTIQYQWQKNGSNIGTDGNAATYVTPPAVLADSGSAFRCIVSNLGGSDTSHVAYLYVGTFPPNITSEPVSRTVRIGRTATFSVTASGTPPLTYVWQKNGAAIPGADSASYTTPATTMADSGAVFRCIVSNGAGHDTSASVILHVTNDVGNLVMNGGFETGTEYWGYFMSNGGSFANDASGPSSPHSGHLVISAAGSNIQLHQQGITLDRDTMYTLRFKGYSSGGNDLEVSILKTTEPFTGYGLSNEKFDLATSWGDFTVQFKGSNFTGTVTDGRLMFWLSPYAAAGDEYFIDDVILLPSSLMVLPAITTHPTAQTVKEGETATFSVAATSITALSYQWEKNQMAILGATLATYTTPVTTMSDNGAAFRCIVTNLGGSTPSNSAVLTVEPATVVQPVGNIPAQYFLAQNYPNPFNPTTMIRFGLPQGGFVTLKVVNLLGQEVQMLVSEYMPAGVHAVQFVADKLPTGMYLYRLQSGTYTETRKLVVVK